MKQTTQIMNGFMGLRLDYHPHARARASQKANEEDILGTIIADVLTESELSFLGVGCGYANLPHNRELKNLRIIAQNKNAANSQKDYKMTKPMDPKYCV